MALSSKISKYRNKCNCNRKITKENKQTKAKRKRPRVNVLRKKENSSGIVKSKVVASSDNFFRTKFRTKS